MMIPTHPTFHRSATAYICSAALLTLACPSAFAVQDCEFNGKHINTSNGFETAGKTGMVRCKDRDTGLVEREYEMRDGQSIGLSRYFRGGKLAREFTVTANGPHEGLERDWAASGQLVLELTNVNGHARGLRRQWFEDGKPRKIEWVAENEGGGAAVEFRTSGQLASLRCGPKPLLAPHVNDGALCGFEGAASTVSLYSTKGDLRGTVVLVAGIEQRATTFFANGKPEVAEELLQGTQKRETTYAEDGGKRREKLWDLSAGRPALLLGEAEFHSSGTLVAERHYQVVAEANSGRQRSRLVSEARFYLNGQPQQKDVYTLGDGNTELRDSQRYTDQGKLKQQGRFAREGRYGERPVGVHQAFFASGRQEREDTFDAKGKVARQKVWDESGKLLSDDELFEDGSRKAYAK
jgi:antitoxin component YwqK of YwqJK toxin-antitoxin module